MLQKYDVFFGSGVLAAVIHAYDRVVDEESDQGRREETQGGAGLSCSPVRSAAPDARRQHQPETSRNHKAALDLVRGWRQDVAGRRSIALRGDTLQNSLSPSWHFCGERPHSGL